ncbi:MAG: CRTAC1 family protein [Vicinamibacterales bacterium]
MLLGFGAACGSEPRTGGPATPPASGAQGAGSTSPEQATSGGWFTALGADAGLRFTHFNGMSGQYYFPETLLPGAGLFDFDNDGDLDVYLVQGEMLGPGKTLTDASVPPPADMPLNGRLLRNDLRVDVDGTRTVTFTDVTDASGIDARGYGMGIATGDFNNDGCVDLYLTYLLKTQLYRNSCKGTFVDVTAESGTGLKTWAVSAAFVDYDRDGFLDLYVGNYVQYDIAKDQVCAGLTGKRDYCTPAVYTAEADRLFRNQGDGTFKDVSAMALLGGTFGPALGVATADFNNDGWIDIYVANDTKPNLLWINQRNGTFREMGLLAGASLTAEGKAEASMGVDAGDFDNDGDEDLYMTELPAQGSNLFVNDGTGQFDDLSARSGLGSMTMGFSGFGTGWLDYDNDGWLDLIQVNGSIQAIEGQPGPFPYAERKLLFRNMGDGRFSDVTRDAGTAFNELEVSRGLALGDIDNDGDTDLLVNNLNGQPRVLLNDVGNRQHWTCVRLIGERTTRHMLGARVEVTRKQGHAIYRRVRSDGSYGSANDPRVLIGLGASAELPGVRVRWPDGHFERWPEIPVDQCITLREGSGRREP